MYFWIEKYPQIQSTWKEEHFDDTSEIYFLSSLEKHLQWILKKVPPWAKVLMNTDYSSFFGELEKIISTLSSDTHPKQLLPIYFSYFSVSRPWIETSRLRVQPPPRPATFFRGDWSWNIFYGHSVPSDSRRAVVSFWRKTVHNTGLPLRGLSLPSKRVAR